MSLPLKRRGWVDYARILRSIHDAPTTAADLAERLGCAVLGLRRTLRSMRALGLIHECAWRDSKKGPPVPVWAVGVAKEPIEPQGMLYPPIQPTVEVITFSTMLHALAAGPESYMHLAAIAGVSNTRACVFIRALRELRMVYVAQWHRGFNRGGKPTALYSFGFDHEDAKRPVRMSDAEYARRYLQRRAARDRQIRILQALSANTGVFNVAA